MIQREELEQILNFVSKRWIDISKDPDQLFNLAEKESYAKIKANLSAMLMAELKDTADPRVIGGGEMFDQYPYRASYKLNK